MASDDVASCRSLPAVLHSIEPTYSEIPDDLAAAHRPLPSLPHTYWEIPDNIAAAQRPLPGLPHTYWEIPDDAISRVERPSSLPAVPCTRRGDPDDAVSCRSLPAVTLSIKPTYSEIPDHLAAAQRPLPSLPCTPWETPDHDAAAQRPLPALRHTYSEIPDDEESGPIPFYADAGFSHHVVTKTYQTRWAFRDNTTTSNRHRSGRSIAPYGMAEETKAQPNSFYKMAAEFQAIRDRRNLRRARVSPSADQGLRTYVNAFQSRVQNVDFPVLSDTQWSLVISEYGACATARRASLPLVTLPNTYWPWELPVISLVVLVLVVLVGKLCSSRSNVEDARTIGDARILAIHPGDALPDLLRSASVPACLNKIASDDVASCISLPAVLNFIKSTYCEIPDDAATAQNTCWGIPDNMPLHGLPHKYLETPDPDTTAESPLSAPQHTYSEIPDDKTSGPMPIYANDAEVSLHVVTNRGQSRRCFRDNTANSSKQGSFATYGLAEHTKAPSNNLYKRAPVVEGIRVRRHPRTALVSQPADQALRTYVNVTDAILSRGQNVPKTHIDVLTMPDAHWPSELKKDGTRITLRALPYPS
uniref:Uncharacterized protein n=1 Tax=Branchiostoma floridae TaxID=7739 RepID=C3YM81_BRAFL|eukprot:XP_002602663.1 hypothetical protein BRAFLDRAFT_72969 [Branchiostoma floridae]